MSEGRLNFPFRESLITDTHDLRFTRRCLTEDLGFPPETPMATIHEDERGLRVIDFARREPRTGPDGIQLTEEGDLAVASWPDQVRQVVWIVAVADSEARAREEIARLAATDQLLPDAVDALRAETDWLAALIHDTRVHAPLLLKRARETPGGHMTALGIRPTVEVIVECDPEAGLTLVRLPRAIGAVPGIRDMRLVAVILAAFRASGSWVAVDEPGVGDVDYLTFRHDARAGVP
jgi:hypothetical protein